MNSNNNRNNIIKSVIFTHQARIRCFLSSIIEEKVERFKNGAVLKAIVKKTSGSDNDWTINIELFHQGELGEDHLDSDDDSSDSNTQRGGKKKIYYVTTSTNSENEIEFPTINRPFKVSGDYDNNTYEFYLVRHGEATHNVRKRTKKLHQISPFSKDSDLTLNGVRQAYNTGKKLSEIIDEGTTLFASDLKRTQQTLFYALGGAEFYTGDGDRMHPMVYILPCSHELNYKKNGKCDGNQVGIVPSENVSTTFPSVCSSERTNDNENVCIVSKSFYYLLQRADRKNSSVIPESRLKKLSEAQLDLDWGFYSGFKESQKCRNTDFINQAIDIIDKMKSNPNAARPQYSVQGILATNSRGTISEGGKTIKKRQNKRTKRKNKKQKKQKKHKKTNKKTKRRIKRHTKRYNKKKNKTRKR